MFPTWPIIIDRAVQKYLPELAPATYKGHTKRQKQGIRSTKEKTKTALDKFEINRDLYLPITTNKENHILV